MKKLLPSDNSIPDEFKNLFKSIFNNTIDEEFPTERCWETGNYTDDCNCEFCSHKHECSGYDGYEDYDEEDEY